VAAENPHVRRLGLITLILQKAGEINGRTKLQKLTYLSNLLWNGFDDFGFHYYGPFSQDLMVEVERLEDNKFLEEEPRRTGNDRTMYKYRLTSQGEKRAHEVIRNAASRRVIQATSTLIEELRGYSSDELEIMASLVYLRLSSPGEDADLVRHLRELKPYFSVERIRRGLRIFEILGSHGVELQA